jgi:hypothetical protein
MSAKKEKPINERQKKLIAAAAENRGRIGIRRIRTQPWKPDREPGSIDLTRSSPLDRAANGFWLLTFEYVDPETRAMVRTKSISPMGVACIQQRSVIELDYTYDPEEAREWLKLPA